MMLQLEVQVGASAGDCASCTRSRCTHPGLKHFAMPSVQSFSLLFFATLDLAHADGVWWPSFNGLANTPPMGALLRPPHTPCRRGDALHSLIRPRLPPAPPSKDGDRGIFSVRQSINR